jgi:uncharacterized protein (TIGR03437 family)
MLCATSGGTGPACTQGSSFSYDVSQNFQQIVSNTYSFSVTAGSLPPGLTLSPNGLLSGTLTTVGQFNFTITLTETSAQYQNQSIPQAFTVVVTSYPGPPVTVDPSQLSFNLLEGGEPGTQAVAITNHVAQSMQFSASASAGSGGNWLNVSSYGSSIASYGTAVIAITADPSSLAAGTYSGTVTVAIAGGQTLEISVLAVVAAAQPNIQLSQTGLRFQPVIGGNPSTPQTIQVLNPGAGTLTFTVSATTVSGSNWLSVSPATGTTSSSAPGTITVTVNSAALALGNYYGTILVSAAGGTNAPRVVSVVVNVVAPDDSPGASVAPTGLIFVGSAGGAQPAAQTLSITNPSTSLGFLVTTFANNGGNGGSNWFTATPLSGSVSSTQPATVSVQPNLNGLAPGVYTGDLILNIAPVPTQPPQTFHVEILLLVLPAGTSPATISATQSRFQPRTSGCTPTQLLPVFTELGTGFTNAVAWPTVIEVAVLDDCGNPQVSGSVTTTFTNGDPALALVSLNNGSWTQTWNATHLSSAVTVTAQAQQNQPSLTGTASISGALEASVAPAVSNGGVVSAANFTANQPLAPGAFAAIFGSNLSAGLNVSTALPLSLTLGGTSVLLGGEELPLMFTSAAQINVVVPYNMPSNTTQQLLVQNGSALSIPQGVVIAPAQPAVFTQNGSGTGAALIDVFQPDGTALPVDSAVSAGDVIVLYCSGLGAINPPVAAGSAAPVSPLSATVNPVTVTIGSMPAQVLFAGLAPGFAQLYQVNVVIPTGLPSGNAVLTLSMGGQQSAPVTISVQ